MNRVKIGAFGLREQHVEVYILAVRLHMSISCFSTCKHGGNRVSEEGCYNYW